MIYLKNEEEIELLRENNLLVSRTLAEVGRHIRPGVTTKELDRIGEEFIRSHGAVPALHVCRRSRFRRGETAHGGHQRGSL